MCRILAWKVELSGKIKIKMNQYHSRLVRRHVRYHLLCSLCRRCLMMGHVKWQLTWMVSHYGILTLKTLTNSMYGHPTSITLRIYGFHKHCFCVKYSSFEGKFKSNLFFPPKPSLNYDQGLQLLTLYDELFWPDVIKVMRRLEDLRISSDED